MLSPMKLLGIFVLAGGLAVGAVGCARHPDQGQEDASASSQQVSDHAPGFKDIAREAGLTWRMSFLSHEQGVQFKTNLYDHGCGVAVGDYDGDGHDDIYFCNQLGKNALYHNKG
ncbi:MAG TPA: hypothetical protein VFA18_03850, partial [Gemmataceae bacterium]|nr:hypothetical protein [Gemmataceae bacterium]